MKNIVSIILLSTYSALAPICAFAEDFTYTIPDAGTLSFEIIKKADAGGHGEAIVTYSGSIDRQDENQWAENSCIEIPSKINHLGYIYEIVGIGPKAFAHKRNVKEVTIPENVRKISEFAFEDCSDLTAIDINSPSIEIDKDAFFDCLGISQISLGVDVADFDFSSFKWSESLKNITLPAGIRKVDGLNSLDNLQNISMKSSDEEKKYECYDGCLYSADSKRLLLIPSSKCGDLKLSEKLEDIAEGVWQKDCKIDRVIAPAGIILKPDLLLNSPVTQVLLEGPFSANVLYENMNTDKPMWTLKTHCPNLKVYVKKDVLRKYRNALKEYQKYNGNADQVKEDNILLDESEN
ncbi:MAG: leucine-rich repeat domain-containing protein [Bacteroidales bacterium]|nr:leucine-rich repeat domain-containing protein [Bacteroidales bacterium]